MPGFKFAVEFSEFSRMTRVSVSIAPETTTAEAFIQMDARLCSDQERVQANINKVTGNFSRVRRQFMKITEGFLSGWADFMVLNLAGCIGPGVEGKVFCWQKSFRAETDFSKLLIMNDFPDENFFSRVGLQSLRHRVKGIAQLQNEGISANFRFFSDKTM